MARGAKQGPRLATAPAGRATRLLAACLGGFAVALTHPVLAADDVELSDEPVPYLNEGVPARPRPLLELGAPFLDTGPIGSGFRLPTGAQWQPQLLVWGTLRTAVQAFDPEGDADTRVAEWRSRLDLFAELEVSATERLVVGFRPFERDGLVSGCDLDPSACQLETDGRPTVLFAEATISQLFPRLSPATRGYLDLEVTVGRTPLLFQDGILLNDRLDIGAVARNNIELPGTTNTRLSTVVATNAIQTNAGEGFSAQRTDAVLAGLFVETDTPHTTANLDLVFRTDGDEDDGAFYGALSLTQRLGRFNSTVRVLGSQPFDENPTRESAGVLLVGELSVEPPWSHDIIYLDVFAGIDHFTSVSRSPEAGGPLGRVGILFGDVGLGGYGAPLGSSLADSAGGALGMQMFFDRDRRWLVLEVGGLAGWTDETRSAVAGGASFQQAIGRRLIARSDAFIGIREDADLGWGARFELLLKF